MHVAVLGPTGFGGSFVVIELLNRGHHVVGVSRTPSKIGKHEKYTARELDLAAASIGELIEVFKEVDVVVNAFNPPYAPEVYKTFVETVRRFTVAAKASKHLKHFITIGGTGSLSLGPGHLDYETAADSRPFWLAYRRAIADSEASTSHMEERIGVGSPGAQAMRSWREARQAVRAGTATKEQQKSVDETESSVLDPKNPPPDIPLAARATYQFFDGNRTFPWSFVSPPARYEPGPRTGKYDVYVDIIPLKNVNGTVDVGSDHEFDGRLLGVTPADLAVAVADEVETGKMKWKHWSPVAELSSKKAWDSYAKLP